MRRRALAARRNSRRRPQVILAWRFARHKPWRETDARRVLIGDRRRCLRPRRGLYRRRRDGRRAAFSDNEELGALRVVTDYKIVTGENAGQNVFQGTRKTSADDFVQRRSGTIVQTDILAEGFKNMTHGVVLDPHLYLVATGVNENLCRRKSRRAINM